MIPCANCEMPDYCAEIGRCFRKGIDTSEEEGEVNDEDDELTASDGHIRRGKVKVPDKLTNEHRDFLKDVLNF